jgi:hypothetical protein
MAGVVLWFGCAYSGSLKRRSFAKRFNLRGGFSAGGGKVFGLCNEAELRASGNPAAWKRSKSLLWSESGAFCASHPLRAEQLRLSVGLLRFASSYFLDESEPGDGNTGKPSSFKNSLCLFAAVLIASSISTSVAFVASKSISSSPTAVLM